MNALRKVGFLVMVLLVALPVVQAQPPGSPACPPCEEWTWNYVGVEYTDENHSILEAVLQEQNAKHGHSNTEWSTCFACDQLVGIGYQTAQMAEPHLLVDNEVECEAGKLKIQRTFEPNEAPVSFWFEVNFRSKVSLQPYWLKWSTNECQGTMEFFDCQPTGVILGSFTATEVNGDVSLRWETASETDAQGFNVFRADVSDLGKQIKLNEELIPAQGNIGGANYEWKDRPGSGYYYYWLQVVDATGRPHNNGPVLVTIPYRLYLPFIR